MSTSLVLAHWNDMWFLDVFGFDMKCFVTCGEHNMSVKNRWLFMPCESQFTMQINRFITAEHGLQEVTQGKNAQVHRTGIGNDVEYACS